jgi:hypothetical protein
VSLDSALVAEEEGSSTPSLLKSKKFRLSADDPFFSKIRGVAFASVTRMLAHGLVTCCVWCRVQVLSNMKNLVQEVKGRIKTSEDVRELDLHELKQFVQQMPSIMREKVWRVVSLSKSARRCRVL